MTAALTSSRPVVGYVGWTGEGNLGDEAMFMAHRMGLDIAAEIVPLPIMGTNRFLTRLGRRISGICLGGGTLIGNGYFRQGLEAVMDAAPDAHCFMVGPGAESLEYTLGRRTDIGAEFARWPALLSRFDAVRVRGPLTVDTLAHLGVHSTVTGDPALLMPDLGQPHEDGLLGLNIGITDDQWGGDSFEARHRLLNVIERFDQAGYRIRLLPTTVQDHHFMQEVAKIAPQVVQVPAKPLTVAGFLAWTAPCHVVVALKLHALVLAATQGTPVIALEYRPKCRDFMASLDRDAFCMRLDQFDPDLLLDWVSDQSQHFSTASQATREAVTRHRHSLTAALGAEVANLVGRAERVG